MFAAPHFLLLSHLSFPSPCLLLVGRQDVGSSPGLSIAFLLGRKLPPPWLLHAVMQQNLCSWTGCSPNFFLGDTVFYVIRMRKVSSCSPDASMCGSQGWEREKRVKTMAMSYWNRLSPKARAGRKVAVPPRVWREWALKTHTRASVENLASHVFWRDTDFRHLEN